MIPFAAVLLAGGQSRRMGRDKALLPLPDGRLLWQRQFAVLQELSPVGLFISGPARKGFPPGIPLLTDKTPGLGPLSGIAEALGAVCSPLLVVLAIDLPQMTSAYLESLLRACNEHQGIVPRHADNGFYEPLAAVYPRSCLPLATLRLRQEDHSLQNFILAAGPALPSRVISPADELLFTNWNEPETEPGPQRVSRNGADTPGATDQTP